MLHRSSLVLRNNNLDFITYLNTNLLPSQAVILDLLHTLEDRRTLIRSQSWLLHNLSLRILYPEDRGGCELPQHTGHREVMVRLVKLGRTAAWMVGADLPKVRMNLYPAEGPEEDVQLGCQMMNGRDNEKITM